MATYDFKFLSVKPAGGWTARTLRKPTTNTSVESSVGPVNALAQNQVTADQLRTTPSTLYDTSLGSRQYMNPNTGIRDPIAASSVYAQSDVPAFLSQSVDSLNAEQALRRSLQAEWQNRLMRETSAGPNAYLFAEALRAASVNPGANVAFGQQIADPNIGRGYVTQANAAANLAQAKARELGQGAYDMTALTTAQRQLQAKQTYTGSIGNTAQVLKLQQQIRDAQNRIKLGSGTAQAVAASPTFWASAPSYGTGQVAKPSGWW